MWKRPSDSPPRVAELKVILITGASSGIGAALARAYAAPGVTLVLTGREPDRLDAVTAAVRAKGARAEPALIDVADRAAMAEWLRGVDDRTPVDMVIANAGISAGSDGRGGGDDEATTRRVFAVNVDGVFNTVFPLLPGMRARGGGRVAVVSSLAGFRGVPGAAAYCASKAAVRVWVEGARGDLAADGVVVSVICPGFVRSRITDANDFPMPFLMDADRAARIIMRGLARGAARVSFPWPMALGTWLLAALPAAWSEALVARMPRKPVSPTAPPGV